MLLNNLYFLNCGVCGNCFILLYNNRVLCTRVWHVHTSCLNQAPIACLRHSQVLAHTMYFKLCHRKCCCLDKHL